MAIFQTLFCQYKFLGYIWVRFWKAKFVKMGAHSLAENISNTLKFNQPICIIGLKVWGIVEKSSSGIRSPCINPNFPKSNFFRNIFVFLKINRKTFQKEKEIFINISWTKISKNNSKTEKAFFIVKDIMSAWVVSHQA